MIFWTKMQIILCYFFKGDREAKKHVNKIIVLTPTFKKDVYQPLRNLVHPQKPCKTNSGFFIEISCSLG